MKKVIAFFAVVLLICAALTTIVFARYNHSSFPVTYYNLGATQTYTFYRNVNNEPVFDGTYTKGSSFFGIVTKKTGNAVSIKPVPEHYCFGRVGIVRGNYLDFQQSAHPTQVNLEINLSCRINNAGAAEEIRYEAEIFQVSGGNKINVRHYDYFVRRNGSSIEIEGD